MGSGGKLWWFINHGANDSDTSVVAWNLNEMTDLEGCLIFCWCAFFFKYTMENEGKPMEHE